MPSIATCRGKPNEDSADDLQNNKQNHDHMNTDNFPSQPDMAEEKSIPSRRPSIVDAKKKGIITTQSTLDTLPSDKSLLEEAAEDEKNRQGSIVRRRLMNASQSFQAVRPAGQITPNFDNTSTSEPANLINQSRNMRRALDLSCHGQRPSELTGALSDIFMDNPLDGTEDDDDDDEHQFKLGDPLHEPSTCLCRSRNSVGRVVNLNFVQWTLMFLIITNSLILGALTFVHDNPVARSALELTDLALLIVFTVELTAQLYYLGLQLFRNGWLIFDCVVIVASWAFEGSELTVMRSFRIFRLFAMVSRWTSLQRLFKAIGKTMPKMGTIAAVLVLFFYSFSVFYTNLYFGLYEDGHLEENYFGRLDLTFLTLFQVMTLDSWTSMVRQVMEVHPWAWVGFVIWVIITAFFFINLIIAVICESLFELNDIKAKNQQKKILKHQNNVVKDETQKLRDENKQLIEIQKEMLANQIIMQKTLLEVVELLREGKDIGAANDGGIGNSSDSQVAGIRSLSSLLSTLNNTETTSNNNTAKSA